MRESHHLEFPEVRDTGDTRRYNLRQFLTWRPRLTNGRDTPSPSAEASSSPAVDEQTELTLPIDPPDEVHRLRQRRRRTAWSDSSLTAVDEEERPPSLSSYDSGDSSHPVHRGTAGNIPFEIRETVSLEDDPSLSTITFRYFVLSILFVIPGAIISQMSMFRTTSAPYSTLFVQIACHYAGTWLANVLPAWRVRIPFTKYGFSLNPGPWSIKEHVLVTVTAASGATSSMMGIPIALASLLYGETIHPAIAIAFMFANVFLGYSLAALARNFVLYDPKYPWQSARMQVQLFEAFRHDTEDKQLSSKKRRVFFICLAGMLSWQVFPEYAAPMLSSLAFFCWVFPRQPDVQFMASGLGGAGYGNISLNWANVASHWCNPMIVPFTTTMLIVAGYALQCWVFLPLMRGGAIGNGNAPLMSNGVFLANGTRYPAKELIGSNGTFNSTAYKEYGPVYMGAHFVSTIFFDYAAYVSGIVWMVFFGFKDIRRSFISFHQPYTDRLNLLMRSYKEVPWWWYILLFLGSVSTILSILGSDQFFAPWWAFLVALFSAVVVIVPFSWLYALTSYQISTGTFNELVYGCLINHGDGNHAQKHRHPVGASVYGALAGTSWYRAQFMLQDLKIGHFMHIPPRATFFSQIFGELLGIPINYAVILWMLRTKGEYLSGVKVDPLRQWSAQKINSYNSLAVQYVLIGPRRMFEEKIYKYLPYGFLLGAILPIAVFLLHKTFKKARFELFNTTILLSSMGWFCGNVSTGYLSRLAVGFYSMFWTKRRCPVKWERYNNLVAAAFDAGFSINQLLLFLFFSAGKKIAMPNWFMNNKDSVERCFALDDTKGTQKQA
ncbi:OPT oligopeptide transporter [Eremomyces bilateralis CBS 781.70]|uniref:OPT oligopeptide transporter n=1 Tax=Eremomyces bilateralis CBS 781.70 TaxID=1392243 RepID=A0A6G1GIF5_9PEZI|nr:OPT oligopeptide transporter [Eremomyces bilateralis CBS 781.70]KAF1817669.1 OPT oligopeptide transporter [Eremomyces bilateralis CBS 781.70]